MEADTSTPVFSRAANSDSILDREQRSMELEVIVLENQTNLV